MTTSCTFYNLNIESPHVHARRRTTCSKRGSVQYHDPGDYIVLAGHTAALSPYFKDTHRLILLNVSLFSAEFSSTFTFQSQCFIKY